MKARRIIREFIALTAILIGMTSWAGDSVPFLLDTTDPLNTAPITYNSSWVGGDSSAEIVISADGTEIKRTTGEGGFMWAPTTAGKHTLTYTTFINGIAQEEVYTAMVFKDWKYTVSDDKATIVETTQKSGSVTIPSKIDGFPVVGLEDGLFAGSEDILTVTMPGNLVTKMSEIFPDSYEKLTRVTVSGEVSEIPQNAFTGCAALELFTIPDGVTMIGMNAFAGCSSLTVIIIR